MPSIPYNLSPPLSNTSASDATTAFCWTGLLILTVVTTWLSAEAFLQSTGASHLKVVVAYETEIFHFQGGTTRVLILSIYFIK